MKTGNRVYLRHRWSHLGRVHRLTVRLATRVLTHVPFSVKYGVGMVFSRKELPYGLLERGDCVVQVGAPHDTLRAGRSRAIYLALCVGSTGRVVVVEPDRMSADALRAVAGTQNLPQLTVVGGGAWSEEGEISFYSDPKHPATNFTENPGVYSEEDLARFDKHMVAVDTLDNILDGLGVKDIRLLSITTNGAEHEILRGSAKTRASGSPYVALARTSPEHEQFMAELGYELLGFDDRGYTFRTCS